MFGNEGESRKKSLRAGSVHGGTGICLYRMTILISLVQTDVGRRKLYHLLRHHLNLNLALTKTHTKKPQTNKNNQICPSQNLLRARIRQCAVQLGTRARERERMEKKDVTWKKEQTIFKNSEQSKQFIPPESQNPSGFEIHPSLYKN